MTKIRAQFSAQMTQNLLRVNDQNLVLWAIDENMGTNLQAFYKHFYIGCLKTQKQQLHFVKRKNKLIFFFEINFFFLNSGMARANRAGRKPVRAGRSALRNRPSWNTVCAMAPSLLHTDVMAVLQYAVLYSSPVSVKQF